SYYDTDIGDFIYKRHSDAAVSSIANNKNTFQQVLSQYGYDGSTYPLKDWMIAAINIPRRSFNNYIGSDEAQRNFIVKAYVSAMQEGISQMAVEALAEAKPVANASSENDVMGLYASIANQSNAEIELTPEGVAFKTTSHLLYGSEYDATRTAALNLPEGVKGAAFKNSTGTYIYVLWAATTTDQAEEASASYTFPASFGESELILRAWDYSSTGIDSMVQADAIELSATPVFLLTDEDLLQTPIALFVSDNQKSCAPFSVNFTGQAERADSYLWHFPGGSPASSTEVNPTVVYEEPGVYSMSLEVSNAAGSHRYTRLAYVTADSIPEADFDYSVEGPWVQFSNEAVNATRVVWNFGDGALDYSFTPRHYYFFNGNYQVQLIAENECGSDTLTQTIVIDSAPSADFQVEVPEGCGPLEVQFRDMSASSPTSWSWSFEGGTPASSIFPNPQVSFPSTGIYEVDLIVSNEFGTDTLRKQIEINADAIAYRSEVLCEGTSVQINGVSYSAENPVDTQRLAMASQQGCDSLLIIDLEFLASSTTEINDTINPGESYTVGNSSYTTTGSYTDTLSNSIGCDSIVVLHLTVLTTGTQEALQQQLDFRAFPNPFDQQLNVSFQLPGEASVSLELVDLLGRRLHRVLSDNSLTKGAHRFELDTSSLPAGLYFCRLIIDNQSVSVGVAHVLDR
ncbi:MAG: PKD domain-containing protein, partial [Bacteroidota bacterium]